MDRDIAKAAARLRWGVVVATGIMAALYLVARLDLQVGFARVEYHGSGLAPATARTIGDGTFLLLLVALYRLTQMLRLIQLGELFSAGVIRRFRGFAFWLMLMALYGFVAPVLFTLVKGAATRTHRFAFALDLRELLTLGITLLLFLLARLLERAREIEAEMQEIV